MAGSALALGRGFCPWSPVSVSPAIAANKSQFHLLTGLRLRSRYCHAGHIANQRNADADERHPEKEKLAEDDQTSEHGQPNHKQERRMKEDFAVTQGEKTENNPEKKEG